MRLFNRCSSIFLLVIILCVGAKSQVNISFDPQAVTRSLYGLYSFSVMNADDASYYVGVALTLEDESGKSVLLIRNSSLRLERGFNQFNLLRFPATETIFYNSPASQLARSAQQLPNGSYTFCLSLELKNDKTSAEKEVQRCFPIEVLRFSEINLVYPDDKDVVCEKTPLLKWQPLLPLVAGVSYDLKITQVQAGQSALQAISVNAPVLYQQSITTPSLSLLALKHELTEGKRYVWQVAAMSGSVQLASSEVWEFNIGCKDSVGNEESQFYILLSPFNNSSVYHSSDGKVPVSFFNPYNEGALNYTLTDLSTNKLLSNLPRYQIRNGLNKIAINLEEIQGTSAGRSYLLIIKGMAETEFKMIVRYE